MTVERIKLFTATCQYAMLVKPPEATDAPGKKYYKTRGLEIWFEVDTNYILGLLVGSGACGTVCTSWNTNTHEMVAIKKISNVFRSYSDAMFTLREVKILTLLKHPNIVTLKDVMLPPAKSYFDELYLVYQFMHSNLHSLIVSHRWPMFCYNSKHLLLQILLAVRYLHSANVIHRDLKPQNILVSPDLHLRICDFGSARTCRKDGGGMKEECVGTQWYRAPEILFCCDNYGPSADMWSVGCIFAELLGKAPIFRGGSNMDQICVILSLLGTQKKNDLRFIKDSKTRRMFRRMVVSGNLGLKTLYRGADPLAIDLLEKMLKFNPEKRITATQALEHPYLVDLFKPEKNPASETRLDFNMQEEKMCDKKSLREQIWKAVLHFHRDQN